MLSAHHATYARTVATSLATLTSRSDSSWQTWSIGLSFYGTSTSRTEMFGEVAVSDPDEVAWYISRDGQRIGPFTSRSSPNLRKQADCIPQTKSGRRARASGLRTATTTCGRLRPVSRIRLARVYPQRQAPCMQLRTHSEALFAASPSACQKTSQAHSSTRHGCRGPCRFRTQAE